MSAPGSTRSRLSVRQHDAIFRTRHPDIQQAPRLFDLLRGCLTTGGATRQVRVLRTDDVDTRELQPLRGMQREQIDATALRLVPVVLREHRAFQKRDDLRLQRSVRNTLDEP